MKFEQGSVLLVSLILLLALTVAGIASIRMSSLEEKMTGNFRNEQVAFHSAEVGILEAENYVANTNFALDSFSRNCTNGLCFDGTNSSDVGTCSNDSARLWEEEAVWTTESRHRSTRINLDGVSERAKYIVEFRCYLPRETDGPLPDPANHADWARYFRITVLATGGGNRLPGYVADDV